MILCATKEALKSENSTSKKNTPASTEIYENYECVWMCLCFFGFVKQFSRINLETIFKNKTINKTYLTIVLF